MRYMVEEVDIYWWFMTPEGKLTEPVLRTKECCLSRHKSGSAFLSAFCLPAHLLFACLPSVWRGGEDCLAEEHADEILNI